MDEFTKHHKAKEYVEEVFLKAEALTVTNLEVAAWAIQALANLRLVASGEKAEIPPFPDPQYRTLEELGREVDQAFRDINLKFPEFGDA